ncbi:actin nucleation-promoting factor WASL isoform X2 [Episyrphus balteatus]|nr:actin nucleation-promoting factor WASL isoform X2 [Episyrphus balteatus]XP_055849591.1 actin nucleation-promoting factor WASL isoform X2 [Episyrphus balteatus]XP_055849592.1 actin nucleation-promoting factor WASL isoform X2 [Episyrphus balteatus]XP_055849593.1 actin nucleation-promoting factor WASL isoform X2 [Episyrphus balteatus]
MSSSVVGGSGGGGGSERQKINNSSDLLTASENDTVFGLLGRRCQSMNTAVVQIYKTEGSAHSHWKKKHTGVVCFVKDSCIRSYFFRAYCLIKNELIWEHEVYETLKLNKARPFLLTFEGQDGHVGLNFVSETECESFFRTVEATMETRNRKRQERRQRSRLSTAPPSVPNTKDTKLQLQPSPTTVNNSSDDRVQMRNHNTTPTTKIHTTQPKTTFLSSGFSLLSNKDKKRKYNKSDISNPTNFVHISHVGWDVNNGFDTHGTEEDKKLTNFLNKAGVSENHMNDRDTRDFIYEFIQTNNVLASVNSEENIDEPKAPEPAPPPIPSRQHQLPQNGTTQRSAPPPPPARQPPPPVPTTTPRGKVPQPPSRLPPVQTIVTAPAAPPPPPPPPPPVAVVAPPPPPMPTVTDSVTATPNTLKPPAPAVPIVNDTRSALMDSIRKGTTLKKVDTSTLSTGSGDSRSELLSEIRSGIELRPVENRELAPASNRASDDSCGTDALADALRRALQERGRVIQSSDDDDSNQSSDNDGEWD